MWADTFREHPDANVGLRLDGLLVVDCDSPKAVEWWAEQGVFTPFMSHGNPEHLCFWYRYNGDALRPGKLRHDVDLKLGPGHQVVIPPSVHPKGWSYQWEGPWIDDGTRLPEAPEDLLLSLRSEARSGPVEGGWDVVEAGGRDDFLTAVAGLLRVKGMGEAGMAAALAAVNQAVCHPPKSAADIKRIAHSVSRYDAGITYEIEGMG